MDQTDIERVRAAYTTMGPDGTPDPTSFHPDVEWHNAPELPGATVHLGVNAMMEDMRAQAEAWAQRRFEPVEIIPTEHGFVVFLKMTGRGRTSGAPVELELAHVLTIRDRKIARVQAFVDRDQALRAAGVTDA